MNLKSEVAPKGLQFKPMDFIIINMDKIKICEVCYAR